jgi:hypothetical protein
MKSLDRIRKRHGRCYELAGKAILYEPDAEKWQLAHGTVWNDVLEVHMGHAWIVLEDGRIYDPVFHEYFDSQQFSERHAAKPERTYNKKEAIDHMTASKNWGPWHTAQEGAENAQASKTP